MEIKIQLDLNLIEEDIIGTLVSDEDCIIGEIISYDSTTGIAICSLYEEIKFFEEIKNED